MTLEKIRGCFKNNEIRILNEETDHILATIKVDRDMVGLSSLEPNHYELGVICSETGYGVNVDPVINAYVSMEQYLNRNK